MNRSVPQVVYTRNIKLKDRINQYYDAGWSVFRLGGSLVITTAGSDTEVCVLSLEDKGGKTVQEIVLLGGRDE